jgi:hypothetical protein
MRFSSPNLIIVLVLAYSVFSTLAGPPFSLKEQHFKGGKSVSLEQYSGTALNQQQRQHVDIKQKQGNGIENKQRQQVKVIAASPFQLFSMYDKRGPWQPSFLPQAPPQAIAVKSNVEKEVLVKGA